MAGVRAAYGNANNSVLILKGEKRMSSDPDGSMCLMLHSLSSQPTATVSGEGTNLLVSILLLVLLIFLNAFFASSEIAIITLNDNKIKKMAEDGNKKAAKILKLTKNSSRFLSTIQIGVTLSGFLASASASQSFASLLADALSFLPFGRSTIVGVSTVIITILLSYFSLVLGELVPKKIAMQKAEALSFKFVGILNGLSVALSPFISFLSASTNFVLRLIGIDPNASEQTVTEEEILMMVDVGEEKGVIGESTKDMIENIFDFHDTTADEIMTHRTDVTAIEDTGTIEEAVHLAIEGGYSRIPVFHEDIDNILGIVYVKDLLKYIGHTVDENIKITDVMRKAYFVPESKRCSELFAELTEHKVQIAIIVDEYGGTEGIITMEDLLESIVGNIQDEYDNEEEEIHRVSENEFTVEGTTSIDEVSDLLDTDLPEGDYDTIAGLVVEMLGRIPLPDEHPSVVWENLTFTVEEVEDRRVAKVHIVVTPVEKRTDPEDLPKEDRESKSGKKKG